MRLLETQSSKFEHETLELGKQLKTARLQLETLQRQMSAKDTEIASVHRQLDSMLKERHQLAAEVQLLNQQARSTRDQLAVLTKENRHLAEESEQNLKRMNSLQTEVVQLRSKQKIAEDKYQAKKTEYDQLLQSYGVLGTECAELNDGLKRALDELEHDRLEIMARQQRIQSVEQELVSLRAENNRFASELHGLEKKYTGSFSAAGLHI